MSLVVESSEKLKQKVWIGLFASHSLVYHNLELYALEDWLIAEILK